MLFRHCFRVLVLTALGAAPGVVLTLWTESWSFLGIALLGGLIGFGLSVSSVVYRTTLRASLRRILKGFAHLILEYNLGGWVADRAVTFEREPAAGELQPGATQVGANAKAYWRRFHAGCLGGILLLGGLGFGLGWKYADVWDPKKPTPPLMGGLLGAMVGGILGFVYGTSLAVLTVPGGHRVRILAGAAVGALLGVGLAIAVSDTAKDPGTAVRITIVALTTIGTAAGLLAPESQPPDEEEEAPLTPGQNYR